MMCCGGGLLHACSPSPVPTYVHGTVESSSAALSANLASNATNRFHARVQGYKKKKMAVKKSSIFLKQPSGLPKAAPGIKMRQMSFLSQEQSDSITTVAVWTGRMALITSRKLKSHQRVFYSCWKRFRLIEHTKKC